MADVFMSYHRSKGASALVRRIAAELESREISCWYDTKNAAPVDFVELIVTEINRCKVFLFIWDEASNQEPFYVRREIHTAASVDNIALVPFRVGNFELNPNLRFYFAPINILYGGDSPETARTAELVNAIAQILGRNVSPARRQSRTIKAPFKILKSGVCGETVTYALSEDHLTISGTGPMKYYNTLLGHYPPWREYARRIESVSIIEGVTLIGDCAFSGCDRLSGVTIPNGVTAIGDSAFFACESLKTVAIPDSVKAIGDFAFAGCANLRSVTIPDGVSRIGLLAFHDCKNLANASIPAHLEIRELTFPDTTAVTRRR